MIVNAGALDRRMDILSASTAKNPLGQEVNTFAVIATTYAQRLELRTSDAARAGQRDSYAVSRFLIRYRTGLTTAMRVKVDGKLYDIRAIDEPDRRTTMVLTVEEVTR